jgi:hypothetical protein
MTGPRFPGDLGRYIPLHLRTAIMERSERTCFYCGEWASTIDHVIPWSQGGSNHPMNLVACCQSCNSIAGDRLFRDITDKLAYIVQRRQMLADAGFDVQGLADMAEYPWEVNDRGTLGGTGYSRRPYWDVVGLQSTVSEEG